HVGPAQLGVAGMSWDGNRVALVRKNIPFEQLPLVNWFTLPPAPPQKRVGGTPSGEEESNAPRTSDRQTTIYDVATGQELISMEGYGSDFGGFLGDGTRWISSKGFIETPIEVW